MSSKKNELKINTINEKSSIENSESNIQCIQSKSDISIETIDESLKWDSDGDVNPNHQIAEMTPDKSFCRFNEYLGMGAFKKVYKGYDFNNGREIAWSVVQIESNFEKIYEEINIMKQLNHPNLIGYITGWYDQEKKEVVIITELLSGGSLLSHLRRITTSPRLRLIKSWIKQILMGLNYLHTEVKPPLIHCDIKCDNICFERTTGKVKIGDLGGCEVLYHEYASHYVGTEEFMAPEVIEGKYSAKADIYSLGISIIELITLELPYKECDGIIMKIYDNAKRGIPPRALKRIKNEKLVELIKICLRPGKERPTAAELLKNVFLNDTTSEENDHPVQFKNIVEIEKTIGLKNQSKNTMANIKTKKEVSQFRKIIQEQKELSGTEIATQLHEPQYLSTNTAFNTSLNSNNTNVFFDISIYENPEIVSVPEKRVLNVTFLVDKKEWLKTSKKSEFILLLEKIDFEYDLEKDTIEEVVVELKNCINLTKEEVEIVKKKLTVFLSNSPLIQTQSNTQPQHQIINCTNSNLPSINKNPQFEIVMESYNKTVLQLKQLLESKEANKLNQFLIQYKDIFHSKTKTCSPNSIVKTSLGEVMNDYNKQITVISKIINK